MIARVILPVLSLLALLGTVLPSIFYAAGAMELDLMKWIMLVATFCWFLVTPFWMGRESEPQVETSADG